MLRNCSSAVSVDGIGTGTGDNIGGIAGTNTGTVENCYATGNVKGTSNVGGIVGRNNSGAIRHSYATGNVTGAGSVGGLVGANVGTSTVRNSVALNLAIERTSGTSTLFGRVAGNSSAESTLNNNHARVDISTNVTSFAGANIGSGLGGADLFEWNRNFWTSLGFTGTWWDQAGRLPEGKVAIYPCPECGEVDCTCCEVW
jgi:hypothetical protein